MKITIRPGNSNDLPTLLSLVKELATFENQPKSVTNTVSRMQKEKDYFKFFVAENGKEIVGIAVYFFAYYTWVGKSLYLDDLYVKSEYRNKKIGKQLLKKIFEVSKTEKCKRVRWQVLEWNNNAIEFYKKYGARISGEWLNCDFEESEINKFNISLEKATK